jgi:hypothetical protein
MSIVDRRALAQGILLLLMVPLFYYLLGETFVGMIFGLFFMVFPGWVMLSLLYAAAAALVIFGLLRIKSAFSFDGGINNG